MAAASACVGGAGGGPAPATAPPTPPPSATPVDLGPPRPDADHIIEHVGALSVEIGTRSAGSGGELRAVEYAREQFERWGYRVEVQSFSASGPDVLRLTTLDVVRPEARELPAVAFVGGGAGTVSGRLVDAGTGREEEFPANAAGAVVLLQRRDVLFADMARRAEQAGAIAMVVANREPGIFRGDIEPPTELPAVNIDRDDGEALRALLAQGPVEVAVEVRERVTARNVIARPETGACRTLSGGHLDSVPWAPGANDNASGSALVLELARAAAAAGLSGHCFALFGAEELGLVGSETFVARMTPDERNGLEAVYNYDVVASDAQPLLTGSVQLRDRAASLAGDLGLDVDARNLPEGIGSDHVSFMEVGIPAILITTPGFELIHTPEDTLANIEPAFLEDLAELGFALLEAAQAAPSAAGTEGLPPAAA